MSSVNVYRYWLVGALFFLLAGCAALPISSDLRHEAQVDLTLGSVSENSAKFTGATVIWGGRILEINNTPQGSEVIVLEMPLNADERPINPRASEGRFIAKSKRFLDPEIFKKGQPITIAGKISGDEQRPIKTVQYNYVVVDIRQCYLWDNRYDYPYYRLYGPDDYGPYGVYVYPYWDWPWYGYWRGGGHWFHGGFRHFWRR